MFVEGIILNCLSQIKMNRSIFGIYHLITGKKSIQSVHDARIFQLEKYYGVYQSISRDSFIEIINRMKDMHLIENESLEDFYQITVSGEEHLEQFKKTTLYRRINGLTYSGIDILFIERLYLLVQTYSNIQANNYSFIPVVDNQDITNWVKRFYQKNQSDSITDRIYQELYELISLIGNDAAQFFVDRLSGYKHYGLSLEQLSSKYNLTRDDTHLYLTSIIHQIISFIEQDRDSFPVMQHVIADLGKQKFITNTANQTYQLFINHYSLEEIARKRQLKLNTIYDHIVEIALYDRDFPIETFVNRDQQDEIITAIQANNTLKLKKIKENCSDGISYFQIRLVLAKLRELLPEEEIDVSYN